MVKQGKYTHILLVKIQCLMYWVLGEAAGSYKHTCNHRKHKTRQLCSTQYTMSMIHLIDDNIYFSKLGTRKNSTGNTTYEIRTPKFTEWHG